MELNKDFLEKYNNLMNEDVELALEFSLNALKESNNVDFYAYVADCYMSLDEFDKANSTFHSAFYQIFDEGIYEDQNYHLELFQSIIICTSNYKSEDDIKSHLGKAIFSRFDAVIKFSSLSVEAKEQITTMQYYKKLAEYDEENQKVIVDSNIYDKLLQYTCQCNNAREISHLIEQTFSRVLLNKLFIELNNHDIT